jgi:hypothetical protein
MFIFWMCVIIIVALLLLWLFTITIFGYFVKLGTKIVLREIDKHYSSDNADYPFSNHYDTES